MKPNTSCKIESPASLRFEGVSGFTPECRLASFRNTAFGFAGILNQAAAFNVTLLSRRPVAAIARLYAAGRRRGQGRAHTVARCSPIPERLQALVDPARSTSPCRIAFARM